MITTIYVIVMLCIILFAKISTNPENQGGNLFVSILSFFAQTGQNKPIAATKMQAEILQSLKSNSVPESMRKRLQACRDGASPWISTLSPAELLITRSHGIRPIAAVSATCWMQYGYSWTLGHQEGWNTAVQRLREEAKAAGANAVVDVKMRTIPMDNANSMDFSLVGTAVKIDGLPPSKEPVIATVSALEFAKLLDANIVPAGIAIGAEFEWIDDWQRRTNLFWAGNTEAIVLSQLWERVRRQAHMLLKDNTRLQGNGALAHINFSQMFKREVDKQPTQYLARHIVIATVVDTPQVINPTILARANYGGSLQTSSWGQPQEPSTEDAELPDFQMVVDLHAGKTPLTNTIHQHQSYASNEAEGAI